jgi:lysophospholipase L1-like esterase
MELINKSRFYSIFIVLLLAFLITSCSEEKKIMAENKHSPRHVLLLGASVGNAWDFPDLSTRLNNNSYKFEFIAKYEPNKSDLVQKAIERTENKPDIIIIKQCAAYVRADSNKYDPNYVKRYKKLADQWVKQIRQAEITPVLATVVPVTEKMTIWVKTKRFIKKHILRKKVYPYYSNIRLEGIIDYNDWVKDYSEKNGIPVLNFEDGLHVSNSIRYLNPEYSTDGLHLNKKAYTQLDRITMQTLEKIR